MINTIPPDDKLTAILNGYHIAINKFKNISYESRLNFGFKDNDIERSWLLPYLFIDSWLKVLKPVERVRSCKDISLAFSYTDDILAEKYSYIGSGFKSIDIENPEYRFPAIPKRNKRFMYLYKETYNKAPRAVKIDPRAEEISKLAKEFVLMRAKLLSFYKTDPDGFKAGALRLARQDGDLSRLAADALMKEGLFEIAAACWSKSVRKNEQNGSFAQYAAVCYENCGNLKNALRYYRLALAAFKAHGVLRQDFEADIKRLNQQLHKKDMGHGNG